MSRGAAGSIQRVMHFFLPREEEFFPLFAQMADQAHEGALVLQRAFGEYPEGADAVQAIADLEHAVDKLRHDCVQRLHDTFVTPILMDRQDIFDLGDMLDDIVDNTKAAVDRVYLYSVKVIPEPIRKLADLFVQATAQLRDICANLDRIRPGEADFVKRINEIENEADHVLKQALAALFRDESDTVEIIKWKEIYDYVEEAIDHCEDTASLIEGAMVKNS